MKEIKTDMIKITKCSKSAL